jgi:hypothetical protein
MNADFDERMRQREAWIDSLAIRPAPQQQPATPQRTPDPLEGQRGCAWAEIVQRVVNPENTSEIGPGHPNAGRGTAS